MNVDVLYQVLTWWRIGSASEQSTLYQFKQKEGGGREGQEEKGGRSESDKGRV